MSCRQLSLPLIDEYEGYMAGAPINIPADCLVVEYQIPVTVGETPTTITVAIETIINGFPHTLTSRTHDVLANTSVVLRGRLELDCLPCSYRLIVHQPGVSADYVPGSYNSLSVFYCS